MVESWCNMTIAEMNKAIEDMRKLYQFEDEHTKITIVENSLSLETVTADETMIKMSKRI